MSYAARFAAQALVPGLILTGCSAPAPERPAPMHPPPRETPLADPDPSTQDPLAFLDALTRTRLNAAVITHPPVGWIRAEHVPALLERLESPRTASPVISNLSSASLPEGERSTEGREAAFLLEGFRAGHYPPRLMSVTFFEPESPEAYRSWWEAQPR